MRWPHPLTDPAVPLGLRDFLQIFRLELAKQSNADSKGYSIN